MKRKEVSVIAAFKNGKILWGKRKDNDLWTNPGGHLEKGEKPIDGAARELFEETGIKMPVRAFKHLKTEDITTKTGLPYTIYAFTVEVPENIASTIKNDPDNEVYRWHWMSLPLSEEVMKNLHSPDNVILKAIGMQKQANLGIDVLENSLRALQLRFPKDIHTIKNIQQLCQVARETKKPDVINNCILKVKQFIDSKGKELWNMSKTAFWNGFNKHAKELIPGGVAEGITDEQINKEDLKKGEKVELEHTPRKDVAREIARDHIVETGKKDSDGKIRSLYYDKLIPMEKKLEKKAAARSEIIGTMVNPLTTFAGIPGYVAGVLTGPYSAEKQKEVNKKSISNILLPGVAGYRLGRRFAGLGLESNERPII